MILDTSVVIAILQREPGWQRHRDRLKQAPRLLLSARTPREPLVVAHCLGVLDAVEALLLVLEPDVVPVDEALARRAALLSQSFGKGQGQAAQLNFGDCFAAALAERHQLPVASAGEDFGAAGF